MKPKIDPAIEYLLKAIQGRCNEIFKIEESQRPHRKALIHWLEASNKIDREKIEELERGE